MLRNDPRMVLIGTGRPVYIHFPASDGDQSDGCSLPLTKDTLGSYEVDSSLLDSLLQQNSNDDLLRLHVNELFAGKVPDLPIENIPYELIKPLADAGIKASRNDLDKKVVYYSISELQDVELHECMARIQYVVNEVLRRALCSMDRIVISFLHPLHNHLLITTSRDTQKGIITPADLMVCDLNATTATGIVVFRSGERQVTSGIQALIAYHSENTSDILLHTHLVFPVLLDEDFSGCYFTKNSPRTEAFGLELSAAFRNGQPYVLRRSEGIWCRGTDVTVLIDALLTCQRTALRGLHALLMPGPV
jgi:hypothetical protein